MTGSWTTSTFSHSGCGVPFRGHDQSNRGRPQCQIYGRLNHLAQRCYYRFDQLVDRPLTTLFGSLAASGNFSLFLVFNHLHEIGMINKCRCLTLIWVIPMLLIELGPGHYIMVLVILELGPSCCTGHQCCLKVILSLVLLVWPHCILLCIMWQCLRPCHRVLGLLIRLMP